MHVTHPVGLRQVFLSSYTLAGRRCRGGEKPGNHSVKSKGVSGSPKNPKVTPSFFLAFFSTAKTKTCPVRCQPGCYLFCCGVAKKQGCFCLLASLGLFHNTL